MQLDKNGDSEGNFSVLAFRYTNNTTVHKNFTCSYQMRPVGQFFQQYGEYPVSEFFLYIYFQFDAIFNFKYIP